MNTKFQLLVVVIAALFSLSSGFTMQIHANKEKNPKQTNGHYETKASTEVSDTKTGGGSPDMGELTNDGHGKEGDMTGILPEDDGITHHFHLERIRQRNKYACLFCWISKIIILLTHVALLICGYCHVISH